MVGWLLAAVVGGELTQGTDGLRPVRARAQGSSTPRPGGLSPLPPRPAAPSAVGRHLCCPLNNAADNHAKHRCPAPGQGCLPRAPPSCLLLLRRPRPVRKAASLSPLPSPGKDGQPAGHKEVGAKGEPAGGEARSPPVSGLFSESGLSSDSLPLRRPRRRCIWASNPAHSCARRSRLPSACLFFLGLVCRLLFCISRIILSRLPASAASPGGCQARRARRSSPSGTPASRREGRAGLWTSAGASASLASPGLRPRLQSLQGC